MGTATVQDLLDRAKVVLAEHNAALGWTSPETPQAGQAADEKPKPKPAGFIDPDDFVDRVKRSGGTSLARLRGMKWEDLLQCMVVESDKTGVAIAPRPLAREIAEIFRSAAADAADGGPQRPVTALRAERMTPEELVKAFDPAEPTSAVGARLKAMSRGEPFLVFSGNTRIVNHAASLELLNEIRGGFPPRQDYEVGGVPRKVYRVGELPDAVAAENPLYPGRPLRPDHTCDQTGLSWAGVPLEIRQLVYVAATMGEIGSSIETKHAVLELAWHPQDAFQALARRYRKAAVRFEELKAAGKLPNLTVALRGGAGVPNPLEAGERVDWNQGRASRTRR